MNESEADLGLASGSVGTASASRSRYIVLARNSSDGDDQWAPYWPVYIEDWPFTGANAESVRQRITKRLTLSGETDWHTVVVVDVAAWNAAVPTQPLAAPKSSSRPAPVSSEETK